MLALPNYLYRHTALTIYVENRDFTVAEDLLHFREYLLCEICFEVMQFHIKNKEPITNPIAIMKHHAKSVNVSLFMIVLYFCTRSETRTRTTVWSPELKSGVATNYTIRAKMPVFPGCYQFVYG